MGMVEIMTFAMGLIMIGCFATSFKSSDDCRLVCSLISDLLDTFWMESKRIWSLVIAGGWARFTKGTPAEVTLHARTLLRIKAHTKQEILIS